MPSWSSWRFWHFGRRRSDEETVSKSLGRKGLARLLAVKEDGDDCRSLDGRNEAAMKLTVVRADGSGNPNVRDGRPRDCKWEGMLFVLLPGADQPVAPFSPFAAENERHLEKKARNKIAGFAAKQGIDADDIVAEMVVHPVGSGVNLMRIDLPLR